VATRGDNGTGIAGALWDADLTLVALALDSFGATKHLLLRFSGDSLAAPSGRPPVPDGWWAPTDSTLAVENTDSYAYTRVLRMFLTVRFTAGASAAEVRAALATHQAVVVGGRPALFGPGSYVVQFPDPGSFAALKAVIATLST
jgi:hypothetical protein